MSDVDGGSRARSFRRVFCFATFFLCCRCVTFFSLVVSARVFCPFHRLFPRASRVFVFVFSSVARGWSNRLFGSTGAVLCEGCPPSSSHSWDESSALRACT
uniref:Putative secreted protein n=1 Tax=Ixodes scapularis TaxID=6945 RepID=A0A4D5S5F1_IXOSC